MKIALAQPQTRRRTKARAIVHESAISPAKIDFPSYFGFFTSFFPAGFLTRISVAEPVRTNLFPRYSSLGRPVEVA